MENVQNTQATGNKVASFQTPKFRVMTGILQMEVVQVTETSIGGNSIKFKTDLPGEIIPGMEAMGALGAREKHFYLYAAKAPAVGTTIPVNMALFVIRRDEQEWVDQGGAEREASIDRLEVRNGHISGL